MLTAFLFFARALISGAFQGIYVYTPEVRGYAKLCLLCTSRCANVYVKQVNFVGTLVCKWNYGHFCKHSILQKWNTCCCCQCIIYNFVAIWFREFGPSVKLTAHNWQKWKRVFLTCPCHKIYRVEAVGLKRCNYT